MPGPPLPRTVLSFSTRVPWPPSCPPARTMPARFGGERLSAFSTMVLPLISRFVATTAGTVVRLEFEHDPRPRVSSDRVPDDVHVEGRLATIVRLDVDAGRRLSGRRIPHADDGVALDMQADHGGGRDCIPARAAERRVHDRHAARVRVAVAPSADRDVVLRSSADVEVTQRDLVTEDRHAVHRLTVGNDNLQVRDRDPHRRRLRRFGTVDEEDGARRDRVAVDRVQTDRPEAERDDARAVRGDRRPVVRHPQSAGRVAAVVRQLRQEDGSRAAVESRLQPRRVVALGTARGRRRGPGPADMPTDRPLRVRSARPRLPRKRFSARTTWPLPSLCPPAMTMPARRLGGAFRAFPTSSLRTSSIPTR